MKIRISRDTTATFAGVITAFKNHPARSDLVSVEAGQRSTCILSNCYFASLQCIDALTERESCGQNDLYKKLTTLLMQHAMLVLFAATPQLDLHNRACPWVLMAHLDQG